MKLSIIIVLLFGLLLSSCQTTTKDQQVKRFGSITGLKADKLARYKELHANAWPEVLKKIKDCHIRNYSIYLQKIKNEYYLFSYFEYTGEDFDGDMKKMAEDPNTQRWWKETDPCQQPLPETAAKNKIWANMEEVFHTN
nr:L-rhamnose mutarotase [Pedobacter sp. ASV19]